MPKRPNLANIMLAIALVREKEMTFFGVTA